MNLTGTWHGRFSFPREYEPISFTADLQHSGEWLTGTTEEKGVRGASAEQQLTATLTGRVDGRSVSWLKTYDGEFENYDAVSYVGEIDVEGLEIVGTWTIMNNWSGSFIMIRPAGDGIEVVRGAVEKV